jgi:uracil-DNA glycosylase
MPRISPGTTVELIPEHLGLHSLREAEQSCRGRDLYLHASQAVSGEGPASAEIGFVGEQLGDEEDRQGHPFVGPAGRLLDRALVDAGIDRSLVYLTNAVKHFKFEERGKRRLHKKPNSAEIRACRPWLEAELGLIQPKILVCLGATAAQTVFGGSYRLTRERGKFVANAFAPNAISTVPPSVILRFEPRIQRIGPDTIAQRLHLRRGHRLEAPGDAERLARDVEVVHAGDGGGDRQAHGVTQHLFGRDEAFLHRAGSTANRLHSQCCNIAAVQLRKN